MTREAEEWAQQNNIPISVRPRNLEKFAFSYCFSLLDKLCKHRMRISALSR
jgi:hypothetical protein